MNSRIINAQDCLDTRYIAIAETLGYDCQRIPFSRKAWEHVMIIIAVHDHFGDDLTGLRGIGFGVGREPLAAYFASRGVQILATDQHITAHNAKEHWGDTGQLATSKEDCYNSCCEYDTFEKNVTFQYCDMNNVPEEYFGKFDFSYSSSSLDHLGSHAKAEDFIHAAHRCQRSGGIFAHTTEYTFDPDNTVIEDSTIFFRCKDIERILEPFHEVCNFERGTLPQDFEIDYPPHPNPASLVLESGGFIVTSILLVLR